MSDREEFEKWAELYKELPLAHDEPKTGYGDEYTDIAWVAWQAAHATKEDICQ
jgi:hypothetical protein